MKLKKQPEMRGWQDVFSERLRSVSEFTHNIHPYFAKFPPEIPYHFIKKYTQQGDIVLDPFCGSGTTLVECKVLNRYALGIDSNPLACLISKVKTLRLDLDQKRALKRTTSSIAMRTHNPGSSIELVSFPRIDYWFQDNVQRELSILINRINQVKDPTVRDVLRTCLSRIVVRVSNQQSESRYKCVSKGIKDGEPLQQFLNHVRLVVEKISELTSSCKRWSETIIYNQDTRSIDYISPESVDLIVTSPPYLNSWDYGLYHKWRFKWLGLDLKSYEKREIGRHLRRKDDSVLRYRNDMADCIKGFSQILKTGSRCIIVNSNGLVKGKVIDTNNMIVNWAGDCGLFLEERLSKTVYGPHYGRRAGLYSKRNGVKKLSPKTEEILIFQKT